MKQLLSAIVALSAFVVLLPARSGGATPKIRVDTVTTIASQLLLQGDLRGHVEDAAWYLSGSTG